MQQRDEQHSVTNRVIVNDNVAYALSAAGIKCRPRSYTLCHFKSDEVQKNVRPFGGQTAPGWLLCFGACRSDPVAFARLGFAIRGGWSGPRSRLFAHGAPCMDSSSGAHGGAIACKGSQFGV